MRGVVVAVVRRALGVFVLPVFAARLPGTTSSTAAVRGRVAADRRDRVTPSVECSRGVCGVWWPANRRSA
jgi:hypothetical protein